MVENAKTIFIRKVLEQILINIFIHLYLKIMSDVAYILQEISRLLYYYNFECNFKQNNDENIKNCNQYLIENVELKGLV